MSSKLKIKVKIPKPRNPTVTVMMTRKAGSHDKPFKAIRRAQNSKPVVE